MCWSIRCSNVRHTVEQLTLSSQGPPIRAIRILYKHSYWLFILILTIVIFLLFFYCTSCVLSFDSLLLNEDDDDDYGFATGSVATRYMQLELHGTFKVLQNKPIWTYNRWRSSTWDITVKHHIISNNMGTDEREKSFPSSVPMLLPMMLVCY